MKNKTILNIFLAVILISLGSLVAYYLFVEDVGLSSEDSEESLSMSKNVMPEAIEFEAETVSVREPEAFVADLAVSDEPLEKEGVQLTIYNSDLALVKEVRELDLVKGFTQVLFANVPQFIRPNTVIVKDLENDSTEVVEQSYEYDLVNIDALLERYLGQSVSVTSGEGEASKTISGKLLDYNSGSGLVLESDEKVVYVNDPQNIEFESLPSDLLVKPTLVWSIWAEDFGKRPVQASYLTGGLSWEADYVASVNEDETSMSLKGWTTIVNESGADFPSAQLKLVAGDVNTVSAPKFAYDDYAEEEMAVMSRAGGDGGFVEESFFEYHLYSLARLTNLADNQEKQISLLNSKNVSVEKELTYDPNKDYQNVRVELVTDNSDESGLGMPLPKGVIRVYKNDSDGQSQFLGEDRIDHTAENEEVRIYVGNAFDVAVEKREVANRSGGSLLDFGQRCSERDMEVEIRNQKKENIELFVMETSYSRSVTLLNENFAAEEEANGKYKFLVPVKSEGTETLTYTLRECF